MTTLFFLLYVVTSWFWAVPAAEIMAGRKEKKLPYNIKYVFVISMIFCVLWIISASNPSTLPEIWKGYFG